MEQLSVQPDPRNIRNRGTSNFCSDLDLITFSYTNHSGQKVENLWVFLSNYFWFQLRSIPFLLVLLLSFLGGNIFFFPWSKFASPNSSHSLNNFFKFKWVIEIWMFAVFIHAKFIQFHSLSSLLSLTPWLTQYSPLSCWSWWKVSQATCIWNWRWLGALGASCLLDILLFNWLDLLECIYWPSHR